MRGDGKTTKQMLDMKPHGLFVWCDNRLDYPQRLAIQLGRKDIRIVSPDFVMGNGWMGICYPEVIIDHAFVGAGFTSARLKKFHRRYEQLLIRVMPVKDAAKL